MFGFSCEKETLPINQLVKDLFCFKEGSVWVYYDSISKTTDTMTITNYKNSKFCSKGFYSSSCCEMKYIVGNFIKDFDITLTAISTDPNNSNTGTNMFRYKGKNATLPFVFICDENNNFYIDGNVTFLPIYQLNGKEYSNVYLFEHDDSKYYIAKNVGAIRIIKTGVFDYVLTNKNVKQ
jgi:hypothetical protein